ncbi:uncharacterized protein BYT42DRAFT_504070 [Radiomyces spectabilis]|uniref:uncharacterized protein n=1 Tax=Radiomyces spectabilis TaxID=64574 RepID=UPI00221FD743|nr:uncharacterized protein BYT42DRAFT_504070 [Radiomyces spectabilis]KAI8368314.1 hypothetical protein BYT42DRAFT_504070 [Radiomyces spectabilis]
MLIVSMVATVRASCSGNLKASSQQDLDILKKCQVYKGSVIVENTGAQKLKIEGLQMIEGDLTVTNNDALQSFSMPSVQGVNGILKLSNNKLLNALDLQSLTVVRSFQLAVHPALNSLNFPGGLQQTDEVSVADTTVTAISGFKMSQMKNLVVTNNIYLKNLDLGNLTRLTGELTVSANSPALKIDVSSLETLNQGSFWNLAGVKLDGLKKIIGDVSFISNSFTTLALPQTTDIAGTLVVSNNKQLNNLSLPNLRHLGGALSVGNNAQLTTVNAFPALEGIDGTLDITGAFDEVELPMLNDVRGGLNVQTSSNHFSCESMDQLKNGVIKGNSFVCKAAVSQPKSGLKGTGVDSAGTKLMAVSSGLFAMMGALSVYVMA